MYIVHISQLYAEVVAENWNFTLVSKKKTLPPTAHILHCYYYYYYCGGHGVYINKNGPLNLWDWFILFMNCLLRMT